MLGETDGSTFDAIARGIQMLSVQFVPFLMAVIFHEYAHGFMANRFGDSTAKDEGRLTLNPTPHVDPIGTLLFPMINMLTGINILIGWAKPVPIDPGKFTSFRKGLFWVSFAGPGMNFILAVGSAAVAWSIVSFVPKSFPLHEPFLTMTLASVHLNFALGIFNLLPLPPLDGSKMIQSFLSPQAILKYESIAPYSFFILLGLMFTGALSILAAPINGLSELTLSLIGALFPKVPLTS